MEVGHQEIAAEGQWDSADWLVAVDPDAVSVLSRLVSRQLGQPVSAGGLFLEECHFVGYGLFGNLEVFLHQAWAARLQNVYVCKTDKVIIGAHAA